MLAQETMLDPFKLFKDMYEKTEESWSETIHSTLQKEAFSEWLGNYQNSFLQYQEFVQKTTENYLKQMNMPTREEVSSVASLIINVEEKIDRLDQRVEDELLTNPSSTEINSIKASVSELDKKMDQILKLLQENEKKASPKEKK